jgi:hypothetical protein
LGRGAQVNLSWRDHDANGMFLAGWRKR